VTDRESPRAVPASARKGGDRTSGPGDSVPESPTQIGSGGWRAVLKRAVRQVKHDDVTDRAAALTYFGILAIFPGLLVLISVLGLLGRGDVQSLLDNLRGVAPSGVTTFLRTVLEQVQGRAGAATLGAIFGVLVALWSASGYVGAFMRASNAVYDVDEGRPIWRTAPVRLAVTIALVIMLVLSLLIVVVTGSVARAVGDALGLGDGLVLAWSIAKWPVLVVLVSLMFSLLYWACPNVKQPSFRWITPGGVLAVVIWLIASGLFAVYVSFSGSYNKTYGSLAAIIIFLVWLWISNIAILLGLEFDAEMQRQRLVDAGLPDDVEPFVELRDTRKLDDAEQERVAAAAQTREATLQSSGPDDSHR
jgi:membrane protein